MNSRWKNYGLWVSLFALMPMLLEAFGVDVLPHNYEEVVKGILTVLVLAGLINNPESGKGYLNDKSQVE